MAGESKGDSGKIEKGGGKMKKEAKILGPTYEKGKPSSPLKWREKLQSREEILKFLKTGERYWYSKEGYGSEKRKTPA